MTLRRPSFRIPREGRWPSLAAGLLVCAPAPGQLISSEELRDLLDRQDAALDGVRIAFEVDHYYVEGSQPDEPEPQHLTYRAAYESIRAGRRHRLEKAYLEAHENLEGLMGQSEVFTWNGAQARFVRRHSADDSERLVISLAPQRDFRVEPHLTWQGWWLFQTKHPRSLPELVGAEGAGPPSLTEDGRTRWRFPFQADTSEAFLIAERGDDGTARLTELEVRYYDAPIGPDASLIVASRIEYNPERASQELPIAARARVVHRHYRDDPAEEFCGFQEIRFRGAEAVEPTAETFVASIGATATVADQRYRITYTLGDDLINLDGRVLETHVPVSGEVGPNLEWWVANGTLGPVIDPETGKFVYDAAGSGEGAEASSSGLVPRPWLLTGLLALAVLIVAVRRKGV